MFDKAVAELACRHCEPKASPVSQREPISGVGFIAQATHVIKSMFLPTGL